MKHLRLIVSSILMLILVIITAVFLPVIYLGDQVYFFAMVLVGVLMLANWLDSRQNQRNEEEMAREKEQQRASLLQFYSECLKNGITECTSPVEIQKAALIAQRDGIKYSNVCDLFQEAKALNDSAVATAAAQQIKEIKAEEEEALCNLIRYSGFSGRDKRIRMLTDEYNEKINSQKAMNSLYNTVLVSSQFREKESNWGTLGGIASGIGGSAMGMAATLNEQAKTAEENARIRAQNKKNLIAIQPTLTSIMNKSWLTGISIESLKKEIEEAKIKLVSNLPSKELLQMITFTDTEVTVSQTGTCTVTVTAFLKELKIYDNVPAVIDGEIDAQIYNGDSLVGIATMVLPTYGIGCAGPVKLIGMATECGRADCQYDVKFDSANLWAMER